MNTLKKPKAARGLCAVLLLAVLALPSAADADRSEALIRELLTLTGTDQMMTQAVDQMFSIVRPGLERASAGKPAGYVDEWYDVFRAEFLGYDFDSAMVELYSKHFTADELQELVVFHRSPVGQKSIQVMPAIMQESMNMGSQLGQQAAMKANEIMSARYPAGDAATE